MTQDRIAALEARIAALEAPGPCHEGHNFQQAIDKFTGLLFCAKCGATITLGKRAAGIGFDTKGQS